MAKKDELVKYVESHTPTFGELCAQSENVKIKSSEDAQDFADWLREVMVQSDDLKKMKEEHLRIPKEFQKWVRNICKQPEKLLEETEENIKKRFLEWYDEETARIEKAKKKEVSKAEAQRKRYETMAKKATEKGEDDKADEFLEKSMLVEVEVSDEEVMLAEGIYVVRNWGAEVTDKKKLLESIMEGEVDMEAFEPNMVYLNGLARRLKQGRKIPGLRFKMTPSIAVRKVKE